MSISRDKISLVHVAKAQLHIADEDYRNLLQGVAGVSSSKELDEAGFTALLAAFERLGFRSTKGRAQQSRREGMATQAQIGKIRSLWRGWRGEDDEQGLNAWLEVHLGVSHVRFMEGYRAGKAIAILLKMNLHHNAKRPLGKSRHPRKSTGDRQ